MSTLRCALAGVCFDVTARECVRNALPDFGGGSSPASADVRVTLAAVPRDCLDLGSPVDRSGLLRNFLFPPYLGGGAQTVPLVLTAGQRSTVADLLARGTDPFSVPLLSAPDVLNRLKDCANHASEVFLILHALTVEIRDYREHRADIYYAEEIEPILCSRLAFEGYRRMFSMFLPDFEAIMIHSSALMRRGRTLLFLGPDGGGKSTVVDLASEGEVLCDDRNILRRHTEGIKVHGTPWGKTHNDAISAPLGGMFLLEKADDFALERINPRQIVSFMCEDNPSFWDQLPKPRRTRVLDLLIEAARSAPTYRLRFPKDYIDWNAVDAAMG